MHRGFVPELEGVGWHYTQGMSILDHYLGHISLQYYLRRNIGDGINPYALNMREPFTLSVARKPVFWVPSLKISIQRKPVFWVPSLKMSNQRKPVFWVPSLKMSIYRLVFKVCIRRTCIIFISYLCDQIAIYVYVGNL